MREIVEENMYRWFCRAIVALKLRSSSQEHLLDENNNKNNVIKIGVQEKISELAEQSCVTCYIFGHTALTFLPGKLDTITQCHFMRQIFKERQIHNSRINLFQIFCDLKSALFWVITQPIVVIPYRRFKTTCRSHHQG